MIADSKAMRAFSAAAASAAAASAVAACGRRAGTLASRRAFGDSSAPALAWFHIGACSGAANFEAGAALVIDMVIRGDVSPSAGATAEELLGDEDPRGDGWVALDRGDSERGRKTHVAGSAAGARALEVGVRTTSPLG